MLCYPYYNKLYCAEKKKGNGVPEVVRAMGLGFSGTEILSRAQYDMIYVRRGVYGLWNARNVPRRMAECEYREPRKSPPKSTSLLKENMHIRGSVR